MKKRKGIAVLLILILSLAVTACGDRYGVKAVSYTHLVL